MGVELGARVLMKRGQYFVWHVITCVMDVPENSRKRKKGKCTNKPTNEPKLGG
jgi:hypothetical protein